MAKEPPQSLVQTQQRYVANPESLSAVVDASLSAAEAARGLNAFAELSPEDVKRLVSAREAEPLRGRALRRVSGVPIALSDDLVTTWGRSRAGSRMLGDYRSPFSAAVVDTLVEAGAIPFGKTNIDELGIGHSTERSAFGPTLHPTVSGYLAGGASGGAAAAVAAGIVPAALAVDTIGSLRQPAAHCGVVGFRPSYGSVSRRGVIAHASSFDAVGVIARSVQDVAWVFSVISDHDPLDGTSSPLPAEDVIVELTQGMKGLRVGVCSDLVELGTSADVIAALERVKALYRAAGATIVDVSFRHAERLAPTAYALATAEASSNFSRYDGVRFGYRSPKASTIEELYERSRAEGFGAAVKEAILFGTLLLTEDYYKTHYRFAQQLRRVLTTQIQELFKSCDILLYPPTVSVAPQPGSVPEDPVQEAQYDRFSALASLASIPAITLNAGRNADGLPVGVELAGARHSEATLLRAAYALEQALKQDAAEDLQ